MKWAAALAVLLLPGSAHADETTFGLAIHMSRAEDGASVVDDAWVARQIDDANALFAPLGVRVRWTMEVPLRATEMHSRSDRDALGSEAERGLVNVYLVRALEDVDEPGRMRMGVCWTGRTDRKRFIVVSRTARPTVLAHELGHFFGNGHSSISNNLMSYTRDGGRVFIDALQSATIADFARRFLAEGALVDVGPPRRFP